MGHFDCNQLFQTGREFNNPLMNDYNVKTGLDTTTENTLATDVAVTIQSTTWHIALGTLTALQTCEIPVQWNKNRFPWWPQKFQFYIVSTYCAL